MKIIKLEFRFFDASSWSWNDVSILVETKKQCISDMMKQTQLIHLQRSLKYGAQYPAELISQMQQDSMFSPSKEFLVFSAEPEKYIDLFFEEIELPFVVVK